MSDTVGSIIDKLITIDMKMWDNQEFLYKIRRMTFEEYKEEFFLKEEGALILWEKLKKSCDLNVQRNNLIDEIDEKIIEIVKTNSNNIEIEEKFLQKKHKTY
tara:strand:- start:39 stop:344 length:306 start_codon:yes stop_codon:yes gene_type:complete